MLKLARIWLLAAMVAGTLGFTGLMDATTPITQAAFYFFAAMTGLSLLFCLFDDQEEPAQSGKLEATNARRLKLPGTSAESVVIRVS